MTGSIGRGPVPMEDNSRGANCCEEAVNYRPREEKPRREYQQRENYNNMAPRNKRYRDIEPLRPSDGDLNFRDDCKK